MQGRICRRHCCHDSVGIHYLNVTGKRARLCLEVGDGNRQHCAVVSAIGRFVGCHPHRQTGRVDGDGSTGHVVHLIRFLDSIIGIQLDEQRDGPEETDGIEGKSGPACATERYELGDDRALQKFSACCGVSVVQGDPDIPGGDAAVVDIYSYSKDITFSRPCGCHGDVSCAYHQVRLI